MKALILQRLVQKGKQFLLDTVGLAKLESLEIASAGSTKQVIPYYPTVNTQVAVS